MGFHRKLCHMFPLKVNQRYPTKTYSNREMYTALIMVQSFSHLGPKIWSLLPADLRQWRPANCLCKLCKVYLPGVGYIESTSVSHVHIHEHKHASMYVHTRTHSLTQMHTHTHAPKICS